MVRTDRFQEEYDKLNKAQREAVDTVAGPVMVIAGPGTGKTQILTLRIANILKKAGAEANEILCLTFTNAAVRAMRERLQQYIGNEAVRVNILTFHKFAAQVIDEFYSVLSLPLAPRILEDAESVSICDQILRENEWRHLHPRGDTGRHFGELKSLVSLLKRERMSPEEFSKAIEKEIAEIKKDPDNLASRGERKGQIKKETLTKLESLERTKEIVIFYELYEEKKREKGLMDHDDTIQYALEIVESSEEARASLREKYQYVLIDEHQDSSGVQNQLLRAIWQEVPKPDIFAVGDDRQLIYAFGGAKMSHFEEFKTMFGPAKVIFLTDNYRSTEKILSAADTLLVSHFSEKKLSATMKENHHLKIVECDYPRDEIIACGLSIKEKLAKKEIEPNDCAILVPKNRQAVSAVRILKDLGLKVASVQSLSLFEAPEFETLFRVLKICANSQDQVALTESLLDPIINIPVLVAHRYLYEKRGEKINLENLGSSKNLFDESKEIKEWKEKLKKLISSSTNLDVPGLIQLAGDEILLKTTKNHEELLRRVEIIRSLLHLALSFLEKNKNSLPEFIAFLERLQSYEENVPLALFKSEEGIKVLTLHGSKGLEFDFVWIAHLDEGSLMKGRQRNFKLPEKVAEKIEEKDEQAAKRELYVALTRAKRFCTLSHARFSYNGREKELAKIVAELLGKTDTFKKSTFSETEEKILSLDPKIYVQAEEKKKPKPAETAKKLTELVAKEYSDIRISVSLLNNFFECPWKWYFRSFLKLPEPENESLKFGNRVHSALDRILKMKKKPTEKEILEMVEGEKDAQKIVLDWCKKRLPEISRQHESEKNISLKDKEFPHLNIYGKIDLLEELEPKILRVTDFKTGRPRRKSEIEKMDEDSAFAESFGEARERMSDYLRQLAIYSYLLRESRKGRVNVKESRLEFLEAGKEEEKFYQTFIDEEKIDLLKKDIKDYDRLLKSGQWPNRPCHFKSYGRANIECEYCQLAKIYKNTEV